MNAMGARALLLGKSVFADSEKVAALSYIRRLTAAYVYANDLVAHGINKTPRAARMRALRTYGMDLKDDLAQAAWYETKRR